MARAGSAEAHSERLAATIAKLRAELAAANERLAQQAAYFMDEMRRLGSGTAPVSGQARRAGQRRGVADRVAQVEAAAPASVSPTVSPPSAKPGEKTGGNAEKPASNGKVAESVPQGALPKPAAPATAAAAEMPQTAAIPGERRKVRLLDRITGLGKA
jgi:hypothetical protein